MPAADGRLGALPDQQSGFRAVRAAHQGRQARRGLHLRAGRQPGDRDAEGGARPRPAPGRHQRRSRPRISCRTKSCRTWATSPLGLVTAGNYSTAGDRPANKAFLAAWNKEYGGKAIPDFFSVDGWDGMAAIFDLIKATKGKFTGDEAMKFLTNWKTATARAARSRSIPRPATSSRTSISAAPR